MEYTSEIIETKYTDNDGQEKIQYWLAGIDEANFYIQKLLDNTGRFNVREVERYIKDLSINWKLQVIQFIPLTENNPIAYNSREFHRGYETDTAPFVYRGKNIPEMEATIYDKESILFNKYGRISDKLTPGMQSWLKSTFTEQLTAYHNEEFILYLQSNAKERAKRRIKLIVGTLKTEADIFLANIEKF